MSTADDALKAGEALKKRMVEDIKSEASGLLKEIETPPVVDTTDYTKDEGINFSLTSLIDQHIKDSAKDKEFKSWRASSLGGCPRSHFYKRLGITQTTPPNDISLRKFEVGNIFHEWIQGVSKKSDFDSSGYGTGATFEHETHRRTESEGELFDKGLDLGGRYDLLIDTDDYRILYDIKTVHSRAFWRLEKSHQTVKEQWPQYWIQLGAYMLMLKRQGNPVDQGRILLVSKDDLVTKEVVYHLTEELEKAVLGEIKLLNEHWKNKTLPPCTCEGWKIEYCNFGNEQDSKGKSINCCSESLWKENK